MSLSNKKAQHQAISMQVTFLARENLSDNSQYFMVAIDKCDGLSLTVRNFENSLIPVEFKDVVAVADAYFPNDDVK
jgi:hypothetical protein